MSNESVSSNQNLKSIHVWTISAPCGSGKTFCIVQEAYNLALRGKRVLLVQPTIDLIEKTLETEIKCLPGRVDYQTIQSKNSDNVLRDLRERLRKPAKRGQITLITHAEFMNIHVLENRENIVVVFIDEILPAEKHLKTNLPETHHYLTDHISVTPQGPIYGLVEVTDRNALRKIAKNDREDQLWSQLRELAWTLLNDAWQVFVNVEKYEKLLAGKANQLSFHCVLDPEIFCGYERVTIAGANLEDSIFFKLFQKDNFSFEKDEALTEKLRYSRHPNGNLVTIYYAFDGHWTKRRQNKKSVEEDAQTDLQRIISSAKTLFHNEPFLWIANKLAPDSIFDSTQGIHLPNAPYGFNNYDNIHNIVVLSASNPDPAHYTFLKWLGVSAPEVRTAIAFNLAYQAALRTSIRTPGPSHKKIYVPDEDTALYLEHLFPGCSLERIDVGLRHLPKKKPGRRKVYSSNSARQRKYKERCKNAKIASLFNLESIHNLQRAINLHECADETTNKSYISQFVTPDLTGTLYTSIKSSMPLGYVNYVSGDHFIYLLNQAYTRVFNTKDENMLISPAIFNPNNVSNKKRGIANIEYIRGIWLDFEDGDLKPTEFPDLFPQTKMVVCNTFSHTPHRPRFRVYIPTTDVMDADTYQRIWDQITYKLEDAGYSVGKTKKWRTGRKSGLDTSKRTACSLFYLPCQAKEPGQSFFQDFSEGRSPLDPINWIENSIFDYDGVEPWETEYVPKDRVRDQAAIDAAKAEWRETPPGMGNTAFFIFATKLEKAGMNDSEIELTLKEEADYGRSPDERIRQIPSIMDSLNQKRCRSEKVLCTVNLAEALPIKYKAESDGIK